MFSLNNHPLEGLTPQQNLFNILKEGASPGHTHAIPEGKKEVSGTINFEFDAPKDYERVLIADAEFHILVDHPLVGLTPSLENTIITLDSIPEGFPAKGRVSFSYRK